MLLTSRGSVRDAIGRVAAGAIAEKWLYETFGVEIVAYVSSVGSHEVVMDATEMEALSRQAVDATLPVRCGVVDMVPALTEVPVRVCFSSFFFRVAYLAMRGWGRR